MDAGNIFGACAIGLAVVGSITLIRYNDRRVQRRKAAEWEMVAATVENVAVEPDQEGRWCVDATYGYQAKQRFNGHDVTTCATREEAESLADFLRGQTLLAEYNPADETQSRLLAPPQGN